MPSTSCTTLSLRVLCVIPGDGRGSSMIFARRQAESVAHAGAEVGVFYLQSRTCPSVLAREFVRFRREARAFRPDLIHAHYGTVTALFSVLASGRIPVVITYRGSDLNPVPSAPALRSGLARALSQCAALGASRIVCVSRGLKNRLWWRRALVTVLASGVDTDLFCPGPGEEARRRLGWTSAERVILFNAGGDPRNKRLDLAQRAVRVARQYLPEIRLEVLSGKVAPSLMPILMNASDCLLVTSDSEGSPTVVQEALATNLPIVSVDTGDVAERLRGVTHTRIVPRDPPSIAQALVELVSVPLRSDGRRIAQTLSSSRIAQTLTWLYRQAVSGANR